MNGFPPVTVALIPCPEAHDGIWIDVRRRTIARGTEVVALGVVGFAIVVPVLARRGQPIAAASIDALAWIDCPNGGPEWIRSCRSLAIYRSRAKLACLGLTIGNTAPAGSNYAAYVAIDLRRWWEEAA